MDCIFCKIINGDIPSYTIYENDYVKCFLDVNPSSNGHCLIIPKKHFKDLYDIEIAYLNEIHKASKLVISILDSKLNPDGYQLIQNNGFIQEVKHYHLHIVPKYQSKVSLLDVKEVFDNIVK